MSLDLVNPKFIFQIAQLLVQKGCDVNVQDKYGHTPLHRAASKGNSKMVSFLLSIGKCQMNLADSEGNTPLYGYFIEKLIEKFHNNYF